MTNKEKHNISKLPQWAQRRIEKLEHDIEYWKTKANVGSTDGTDTLIWRGGDADTPLEPGARIRFRIGKDFYVNARVAEDYVEIHSNDVLAVVPSAANAVQVGRGRYR